MINASCAVKNYTLINRRCDAIKVIHTIDSYKYSTMIVPSILFVALWAGQACLNVEAAVCQSDVDRIKGFIESRVNGRKIAHVMRLFFHDCVGESCDGCVNLNNPDNAGNWQSTINNLNNLYVNRGFGDHISYADYYTLCAIVAIEQGVKNANSALPAADQVTVPNIPFTTGRQDCATAPTSTVIQDLPAASLDHGGLTSFFADMFNFNVEETVCIMGAHTLGGATGASGSGYVGLWKDVGANNFDNGYYTQLTRTDLTWRQVDKSTATGWPTPRWQWDGRDDQRVKRSFMLQADLATFLDITVDGEGKSSCGIGECPENAEGLAAVNKYAGSYQTWLDDFQAVFLKMSTHGVTQTLEPLDATC